MRKNFLLIMCLTFAAFLWMNVQTTAAMDFSVLNFESEFSFLPQARYGALAIDEDQGSSYGFSYNYTTQDAADDKALTECGGDCTIVQRFTACAAYAADQTSGSTVYGWAQGSTGAAVKTRALDECQSRGGARCIVRVWACNGR